MTMSYKIMIGHTLKSDESTRIQNIIDKVFFKVDSHFNKYNPNSELSKLNQLDADTRCPLTPDLAALFEEVSHHVKQSNGRFDPTVEPIQELWKPLLHHHQEPSSAKIASILPAIGWHHIHIEKGIFWKDHDKTALDLGGIAKGYAIDLLIERLQEENYTNLYVEWGGEIRTSGIHPSQRPWRVAIYHPFNSNHIDQVELGNEAIATSGDYMQSWTVHHPNGETTKYTHIFHPKKGSPLLSAEIPFTSVSVVAPTCMEADALATTAMLFETKEEAQRWAEAIHHQQPAIKFWFADA